MASYTFTIAHEAAIALAESKNEREFINALETIEIEPLDALYSFIGSYLEDRQRRVDDFSNEPF